MERVTSARKQAHLYTISALALTRPAQSVPQEGLLVQVPGEPVNRIVIFATALQAISGIF